MHSSAIRGCHEEGFGGGTTLRDLIKLPGHAKLILWPEIRASAAERALDRKAWRDAIKNLAPMEFQKPQQVGRMTWFGARRDGNVGLVADAVCNDCDLAAEVMDLLRPEKPVGAAPAAKTTARAHAHVQKPADLAPGTVPEPPGRSCP
eukprot:351398-Chlamydomonas_euryale.AAC.7